MREYQRAVNDGLRKYVAYPRPRPNSVTPNPANSIEHETFKFLLAYRLIKRGHTVFTEVQWAKPYRGRADIYVPALECYIEIAVSEDEMRLMGKREKYPPLAQLVFRAGNGEPAKSTIAEIVEKIERMPI